MDRLVLLATVGCWLALAAVWVVAAVHGRASDAQPTGTGLPPARRGVGGRWQGRRRAPVIAAMLVAIAGLSLLGALGEESIPPGLTVEAGRLQVIGLGVLVSSTAFAAWARLALGAAWSPGPRVVADVRLRTSGPYGVTRHPIYTGAMGMVVGTALVSGSPWAIPVVIASLGFVELKIRREERQLLATFPTEYPGYRARVPQLIPGLLGLHR